MHTATHAHTPVRWGGVMASFRSGWSFLNRTFYTQLSTLHRLRLLEQYRVSVLESESMYIKIKKAKWNGGLTIKHCKERTGEESVMTEREKEKETEKDGSRADSKSEQCCFTPNKCSLTMVLIMQIILMSLSASFSSSFLWSPPPFSRPCFLSSPSFTQFSLLCMCERQDVLWEEKEQGWACKIGNDLCCVCVHSPLYR